MKNYSLKRAAALLLGVTLAAQSASAVMPISAVEEVLAAESAETEKTVPEGLTYEINAEAVTITGYSGEATELTLPSEIEGYPVTSIGHDAFNSCSSLTSVTIPSSLTSIGDRAFYRCISLTDVFYAGNETEWNQISIGNVNESLLNATIHFESSTSAVQYGDVDGNNDVDASDALVVLKAVVKLTDLTEAQEKAADVDGSGKVDASDALMILKKVVNLIDSFTPEQIVQ